MQVQVHRYKAARGIEAQRCSQVQQRHRGTEVTAAEVQRGNRGATEVQRWC